MTHRHTGCTRMTESQSMRGHGERHPPQMHGRKHSHCHCATVTLAGIWFGGVVMRWGAVYRDWVSTYGSTVLEWLQVSTYTHITFCEQIITTVESWCDERVSVVSMHICSRTIQHVPLMVVACTQTSSNMYVECQLLIDVDACVASCCQGR